MFKILATVAVSLFSFQTFATSQFEVLHNIQQSYIEKNVSRFSDWKVGDSASYDVDMGIVKGTMVMSVRSIDPVEGTWLDQDMDLGFAGQQKIETLLDPNTGQVKKLIVNGKEEQAPTQDIEIIETKQANVTVPAGAFECVYVRMLDKTKNNEVESWLSDTVSLSGMVKSTQPSQFGQVVIELTSFNKQ